MPPVTSVATASNPLRTMSRMPDHAGDTDHLGDAIAELAARLHAATYELLVLLHQFDEACGWNNGFRSCAHWLHWRTGIDLGAAREKVRVAKALAVLPQLSAVMQRGEVSYAKVRAITRVATSENESQLVDVARCGTAAHVERLVRAWRRVDRVEAARQAEARHLTRHLTTWMDDDGMVVVRGRLAPEVGAVVQRALEAAVNRLAQESARAPHAGGLSDEVTAGQRRADALGLLAECALAADLDRGTAGDRYQVVLHVEASEVHASIPEKSGAEADAAARDVTRDVSAEAYGPLMTTQCERHDQRGFKWGPTSDGLEHYADHAAMEVGGGALNVPAETYERLACDAAVVVMRHDVSGSVMDVGRKTRTIPPSIRRALAARDPWCQFPGCTARRCDAHHLTHWAHGGSTILGNLVHLCPWHHRMVHEGGYRITRDVSGNVRVARPDGAPLPAVPPQSRWIEGAWDDPLGPAAARLAAAHITIGPYTATSVWDGQPLDVGWAIDVLRGRPVGGSAIK